MTTNKNDILETMLKYEDIMILKGVVIDKKITDSFLELEDPAFYYRFINALDNALSNEKPFFLMNEEFLDNTQTILESQRSLFQSFPGCADTINSIIRKINEIRSMPMEAIAQNVRGYVAWNLETRKLPLFTTPQQLYTSMAADVVVISMLQSGEIPTIGEKEFIASTNYIAEVIPEFYKFYPEARNITMNFLDEVASKKGFKNRHGRKKAITAVKKLEKIKAKEE